MSTAIPKYSNAFEEYTHNRYEVVEILHTAPTDSEQLTIPRKRALANALFRGSVMLLSGHLEKYVESLVVEAIDAINRASPAATRIPARLRLVQVEEELFNAWNGSRRDRRQTMTRIKESVIAYPWIWGDQDPCGIITGHMLVGENNFSNPNSPRISNLLSYFDIDDAVSKALDFYEIHDKSLIETKVNELIDKRNQIAHTAATPSLTRQDVIDYLIHARRLVRALDIIVGGKIDGIIGSWPWK